MLGVAIRIAERMGINSESALAKCSVLEAELRRRLWWSIVLFDTRISELASHNPVTLAPTWDCRIPLNVNDFDLRPEMKEPPVVQGKSTDALFAVVRSELGEFVRHMMFHLEFTSPALKPIFETVQSGLVPDVVRLDTLENMIEDKYLKFCDPENPLHFMTIWWTRGYIAKCRIMEHHSRYSNLGVRQTDSQHDTAISHALRMIECNTKFAASPFTEGFLWLVALNFPFPAYVLIARDLRKRPTSEHAEQAWEVMSDNFEAWLDKDSNGPFFTIFTKFILLAWEAREAALGELGESLMMPPRIVSTIRNKMSQIAQNAQVTGIQQPENGLDKSIDNFPMLMPMGSDSLGLLYDMEGQGGYGVIGPGVYPNIPGQSPLDVDMNHLDWSALDWGFEGAYHSGS